MTLEKSDKPADKVEPKVFNGEDLFELRLTETATTSGSLPVTWCVDKSWLLANSKDEHYVLFSTATPDKGGKTAEWRGYAKLSEMMTYVTFFRPGKNRILARVTPQKSAIGEWMLREDGGWANRAMKFREQWESEEPDYLLSKKWRDRAKDIDITEVRLWNYIDINLPSDCFAKDPSAFEKYWVNYFFRQKAVDQCEFRRRRILAYTFQPFAVLFTLLLKALIIFCVTLFNMLCGHWTKWDFPNCERGPNFLKIKKFGLLEWLVIPIPWLVVSSLVLYKLTHRKLWFLLPPAYLAVIGAFLLLVVIFMFTINLGSKLLGKSSAWRSRRERLATEARKKELERLAAERKAELEALETLLCSNPKRINRISDLPRKKRTVKLRFQGLKSSVCKPFAK
jgi:hypothetical protein